MDQAFLQLLKSEGIAEDTIEVLCSEAIISKQILNLLHEEHLQKLLGKTKAENMLFWPAYGRIWRLMVLGVKQQAKTVSCSDYLFKVWVF